MLSIFQCGSKEYTISQFYRCYFNFRGQYRALESISVSQPVVIRNEHNLNSYRYGYQLWISCWKWVKLLQLFSKWVKKKNKQTKNALHLTTCLHADYPRSPVHTEWCFAAATQQRQVLLFVWQSERPLGVQLLHLQTLSPAFTQAAGVLDYWKSSQGILRCSVFWMVWLFDVRFLDQRKIIGGIDLTLLCGSRGTTAPRPLRIRSHLLRVKTTQSGIFFFFRLKFVDYRYHTRWTKNSRYRPFRSINKNRYLKQLPFRFLFFFFFYLCT